MRYRVVLFSVQWLTYKGRWKRSDRVTSTVGGSTKVQGVLVFTHSWMRETIPSLKQSLKSTRGPWKTILLYKTGLRPLFVAGRVNSCWRITPPVPSWMVSHLYNLGVACLASTSAARVLVTCRSFCYNIMLYLQPRDCFLWSEKKALWGSSRYRMV